MYKLIALLGLMLVACTPVATSTPHTRAKTLEACHPDVLRQTVEQQAGNPFALDLPKTDFETLLQSSCGIRAELTRGKVCTPPVYSWRPSQQGPLLQEVASCQSPVSIENCPAANFVTLSLTDTRAEDILPIMQFKLETECSQS